MGTKKLNPTDDPLLNGLCGLISMQMRAADAGRRKQIYADLYAMHAGAKAQGQPRTAQLFYGLAAWANLIRQQLDPH